MSLPSIAKVAEENKFDLTRLTPDQEEILLVEAMRCDLPLAVERIHALAHEAQKSGSAELTEDPKSLLGGQLIRICASDAARSLAAKHFCHGLPIFFANCCVVRVGAPPENLHLWQIQCQAGPIAYADC